jgi:hypothetical protein
MTLVGAVAALFYHLATLVSVKLEGRTRTCFQVAVSLAVPIVLAFILSARVDALPFETLSRMLTPWLLLPLGIIGLIGWCGAMELNRNHPFRPFLVTSAVLFVLCWIWNSDMADIASSSDPFLDRELVTRKKETGAYVYRYVLYVLAAYTGLFLGFLWRGSKAGRRKAVRELAEALTPATVEDIVSKMGGYIANRRARFGRVADLPFPKTAIEMAFIKAIRDCTDPEMRAALEGVYITLDDYMLTDEDCAIVNAYRDLLQQGGVSIDRDSPDSFRTLAEKLGTPEMLKAVEIQQRLADAMHRRSELIDKFSGQAE